MGSGLALVGIAVKWQPVADTYPVPPGFPLNP